MCGLLEGMCSHGCVNTPVEPGYVCVCPDGKALNNETGQCMRK